MFNPYCQIQDKQGSAAGAEKKAFANLKGAVESSPNFGGVGAMIALDDRDFVRSSVQNVREGHKHLKEAFAEIGEKVYCSRKMIR